MPIPGNSKLSARYCAICEPELYWPYHPDYTRCPKCDKPTILKTVDKNLVMTPEEAKRQVTHIQFEQWLKDEDPTDRANREAAYQRDSQREEWEREEERKFRRQRFDEVIESGGFSQFELDTLKATERALPTRSNNRYENPLAE